ncbi:MAG: serine/threonine-protein phosphatase [Actinomycetota bacterium]|nr:serine/threonine-protein phosphatase [Actinomycetota bacterium]
MGLHPDFGPDDLSTSLTEGPASPNDDTGPGQPSQAVTELVGYARHHAEARLESGRARPVVERMPFDVPGVALAGRVRPWGVFVESGGDWFDALPLDGGRLGIVVGNVAGRGVEVAATMSDLKMAARAYVVLDGGSPARVVSNLDRLAEATGLGDQARLLVLALDPATGEVRFSNAGGCPPLVVDGGASTGRFVEAARAAPLGGARHCARTEATLQLATGSTLLLFTDGLVESAAVSRATGLERLRQAATGGPAALDALCDHVLNVCTRRLRRDDDICVLGARLLSDHALAEGPSDRSGA